jgi:hypothetical protein
MSRTRIVIVVGLVIAASAAVAVVLVPRWVKARIIAAAAAHGVALTIDDLSIAPGRTRLKGVRAAPLIQGDAKKLPKIAASAATVDVELDGLTPTAVTVTGMVVDLDGSAEDVRAAIAGRDQRTGGGTSPITRVMLSDATFTWKHLYQTNLSPEPLRGIGSQASLIAIDGAHVSGNVTRQPGRALGDDWHIETSDLRAFDAPSKAAPWALVADGDAAGTRATLTLSPTASVRVAVPAAGGFNLDVDTPNASVTDLGIPSAVLGMYGDETSRFEIHLHHAQDAAHAKGTLVATASDVFIGVSTARTSLTLDARYAGDPSKLDLAGATLHAGPFTGTLEGWFAIPPSAQSAGAWIKASVRYASGVVSCLDAVKAQITSYGDVGKGVAALAGMLGLDRVVEGRVMLKGEVEIDAQTPSTNRFAFHTEGDCKLSYLPF